MKARSFRKFTDRLAAIGLLEGVEKRAMGLHVTLQELYDGPGNSPSVATARRAVYAWLMKQGKGLNEVARLFDRAPSGVQRLTRGRNGA
jgi:hypothetical protein